MVMNPIPPQAYTKDTLVQAYAWLQNQSVGIREMASNPDILVSLFLKAQRQGDECLERPSIQNFKTELKNLAGMMGELEGGRQQAPPPPPRAQTVAPPPQQPRAQTASPPPLQQAASPRPSQESMDSRSLDMIHEVKNQFNLSSDQEALRLLISVGFNQLKSLIK